MIMTHGKSVVVPVEPTEAMIKAGERAAWDFDNSMPAIRAMPKAYAAMLLAAPAPSSLAGGEVLEIIETLEALTKRQVFDAFDRGARAARLDALDMIRPLAALSPEAPAREGAVKGPGDYTMVLTEPQAFETFPALASHIERMAVGRSVGSLIEWDAFLQALNAALTPRHEAPAEGAGVARDRLIEVLKRMDDGVYASLNDQADAVISALILQPKDPAEVGAEVASAARALLDACYKADENSDLSDFVDGMLLTRLDKALRARSSAPEAREEALGNLLAVIHGDGGHRALEVGTKQAALEAEKIVAGLFAAPSADKLRIAVEALEPFRKVHDVVRSKPGAYILTGAAGITVSDVRRADQALAVLKAEGEK